ncbi:glycosyltransferase [Pseudokineococcus basanitobsidens]|uniref:Glycosyltransferase n=1 Tax=Pseudokineococcus basanitobsidens TaxID=1926649 RepID=A0ABU8RMI1_9ACTN
MSPAETPSVPSTARAAAPVVLVLLGTDHHPFRRLVEWSDAWGAEHGGARVVVQHGRTTGPERVEGRPLVPHAELQDLLQAATVVVSHGGPATIMEARRAGRTPVVVPRDPTRGEHVDSHQQLFSRRMAREGTVLLCEDVDDLGALVDHLLAHPGEGVADADGDVERSAMTARRIRAVLEDVVARAGRARR